MITPEFSTDEDVADQTLWNHTGPLSWEITFDEAGYIGPGQELIQPHNVVNYTTWTDISAGLNFSNYTRDVIVDTAVIEALYVNAPEVILGTEIRDNSTAFSSSDYGLDLPDIFLENGDFVVNLTQRIIDQSGAISAWDKVTAIQDFIVNGNDTITFLRNHDGSGRTDGIWNESDVTHWILNSSLEGSCDEFTTVFVTMLRIAGIPSRKVTGFSGGTWDGKDFNVFGKDFTRWAEVHLQTNQNQGELDLGWIPFEACPEASSISVSLESWGPESVERNISISDQIWVEGQLLFLENSSAASNISISLYLVDPSQAGQVPGSAAIPNHLVASTTTDSNGSFNLTGLPDQIIQPGLGTLVLLTEEKGYVASQGISQFLDQSTLTSFLWSMNISDDVNISIISPSPVEKPMLGIGVNSTLSGYLSWASPPDLDPSVVDTLQIILNYSSTINGEVSISSDISGGGYFEFTVPIDESEPLGYIGAAITFSGWHLNDLNNASSPEYHARPTSYQFQFNITLSPNITLAIEAQGANNSILEIDDNIYLNGTVLSRGPSPSALNGTMSLEMRRQDIPGPFQEIKSWYLNNSSWGSSPGNFSIAWLFAYSEVPLPAGPVEIRVVFDADGITANDQELFSDTHGIRSIIVFDYEIPVAIRGDLTILMFS